MQTLAQLRARGARHGLSIARDVLCPITLRRKWNYATQPNGNGTIFSHGHFDTLAQIAKYFDEIDEMEHMMNDTGDAQ